MLITIQIDMKGINMLEGRGYANWFSGQIQNFEQYLNIFKDKDVRFLQIGAYLGHASKYMLDNVLTNSESRLVDIDTWTGSTGSDEEMHKQMDWEYIENKYDEYLQNYIGNKLIKYKGTSDSFFEINIDKFDFIYIDGHHEKEYVERDAINSLNCIKDHGVIAFDDAGGLNYIRDIALDLANKNGFEILMNDWQVWMKR